MSQIKIPKTIEKAESSQGTYWKVEWDDGKHTAIFDENQKTQIEQAIEHGQSLEINFKKDGKYWNIKDMKTVEQAEPKTETLTPVRQYMPRDNSASIESQVAVKVGAELLSNKIVGLESDIGKAVVKWCLVRLLPPIAVPDTAKGEVKFANIGELFTKCWAEPLKVARPKVLEIAGVKSDAEIKDYTAIYKKVVEYSENLKRGASTKAQPCNIHKGAERLSGG